MGTQIGVLESKESVVRGDCSTVRLWRKQLLLIHMSGLTQWPRVRGAGMWWALGCGGVTGNLTERTGSQEAYLRRILKALKPAAGEYWRERQ